MTKKYLFLLLTAFSLNLSCNPVKKMQTVNEDIISTTTVLNGDGTKSDVFFTSLFNQYPQYFDSIVKHSKDWNVQIIYTQIDRDANNFPKLTNYYYNVNPAKYFYPASTVKLPVAVLALQRLNELKGKGITSNTTMITEAEYSGQTEVYKDTTAPGGKPTIGHYIKKILLTSDNDAFNRLYEFLGQKYINKNLHRRGYSNAQVLHRLDIFLSEDENRHTNPVKFLDKSNTVLYSQPLVFNKTKYVLRNDSLGKAYYKGDELIDSPMNFSKKNRIGLEDMHNILRSLIFPNSVPANQRFDISHEDYKFIYQYMSQYPSETMYPQYDTSVYYDAYVKFLLHGLNKEPLPKNIRIFNKVGDAYGQMIDVAYVVDLDKKN